ncbi:MAG: hypothetical protein N2712_05715 [Brevinematales bacterium]|nr:hypothetical protein [Brevinematales bacterium]
MRDNVLIGFSVISFIFAFFVIFSTLYRSYFMLNKYFPGFFIYYTGVINIYDIPEWWAGKTHGIPNRAVLIRLNDREVKTPSDFWNEVFENLDREIEYEVYYEMDGEKYVKFVKSQRFEAKDFIFFTLFWQSSGVLLLLLGFVMFLSNRSKKGVMWLVANTFTGLNFITTPSSSLFSDVFIITFVERLTFSIFPVSMVYLFLHFPLVKFKKHVRYVITSIVASIGLSFVFISLIGYTNNREVVSFQEMYYFYPGIGGIFAVLSPVYDYIRAVKHGIHNLSRALLPLMIGSFVFILIPSVIAILTTAFSFPSYYIPIFIIGYPILVMSTVMVYNINFVKETSLNLLLIILISFVFTTLYVTVYNKITFIPKTLLFMVITLIFSVLSVVVFSIIRSRVKFKTSTVNKDVINDIISKFRMIDKISKFFSFLDRDLGRILNFSFSKFVSYKLIPKDVRKMLFLSSKYFINKDDIINCCKSARDEKFRDLIEKSRYAMAVKYGTRFFGVVMLGKEVGGSILTSREIELLEIVAKLVGGFMNSLVKYTTYRHSKDILKLSYSVSTNVFIKPLIYSRSLRGDAFEINAYVKSELDKPVVYKLKETENGVFFCIVWILPNSIHSSVLVATIKGFLEDYFHNRRISIDKLPREIRNIVYSLSPIEVDTNIVCGVIRNMEMNVVNDGKSSILLVTKYNSVIPMPVHKRYFNFSKIKEGDTFFFISGEEIVIQLQEIKDMGVKKFTPQKLITDLPDKFILEIRFLHTYSR